MIRGGSLRTRILSLEYPYIKEFKATNRVGTLIIERSSRLKP